MDDNENILEELRLVEEELDAVMDENDLLRQLLTSYLSEDDKLYIRIKYNIEL